MKLSKPSLKPFCALIVKNRSIIGVFDLFYNVREDLDKYGKKIVRLINQEHDKGLSYDWTFDIYEILEKLNSLGEIKSVIEAVSDPREYINKDEDIEDIVYYIDEFLKYDGYVLKEERYKYVVTKLPGVGVEKSAEEKQPSVFTKVDDWKQLNVYLKKSDIRYIRFEYPPNEYDNNTLKTNELQAGDTMFTGSKGKNKPYIIMEDFIEEDRIERYDAKDKDYSKSISNLNKYFTQNFKNNYKPIKSDPDLSSGYITEINFRYEK